MDLTAIFRYTFSRKLDIEIGFGRKNRVPSYQELYLFTQLSTVGGLADGNTYLGNINLAHETAYQFDLAFRLALWQWLCCPAFFLPLYR